MARSRRPEALRFDFDAPDADAPDVDAPDADAPETHAPEADALAEAAEAATVRVLVREPSQRPAPLAGAPSEQRLDAEPAPVGGRGRGPAAEEGDGDTALSVAQFYDRVRAALNRALPGEVWVTGEIRKVSESKGHRFLELADHDDGGGRPSQQLEVVCWSRDWYRIGAQLARAGVSLEAGRASCASAAR